MFNDCMTTLAVTDLERAKRFYTNEVKLKEVGPLMPEGGDFVYACGDHRIYLYERDAPSGSTATVCSLAVDDVEKAVRELKQNGVRFEEYDMPGLKTQNGIATMGPMKVAWFKDPDGNILAVSDSLKTLGRNPQVQARSR